MKSTTPLLAAACALLLATLPVSAQVFVGSDNFNDNTLTAQFVDNVSVAPTQAAGQYRFVTNNANGTGNAWTETNQRMEYSTSNTAGFNRGFLGWSSPSSSTNATGGAGLTTGVPYTSSWTAQVEVTNNLTSLLSGFSSSGFEIYTTNATNSGSNAYYGIGLNTIAGAQRIVLEWGAWDAGTSTFTTTQAFVATTDTTNVLLRMTYDGTTKVLATDFSNDGGANFLTGASYDLDGAQIGISAPGLNGFGLEFYASASAGNAINPGDIYFDNLSVSAIPEPSTYAAFAGLGALGLAFWQRRRKTA